VESATRYHPSPDQLALASTIEESLAPLLPISRLHASLNEDERTWSSLDEIGIFGITASEEAGGSGLGAVEEALIAMALGRQLAAPSVLATLGAAHAAPVVGAAGSEARPTPAAPMPAAPMPAAPMPAAPMPAAPMPAARVAAGWQRGDRTVVVDDGAADRVLVRAPTGAAVYARTGSVASRPLDRRLWLAELSECDLFGEPLGRFDETRMLRLRLIDAAALSGIAAAALDMGVSYAGAREQFGRPIGSFQAIKHHCANMAIAASCARDQVRFAAVAVDDQRGDAALQVECALWVAGSAALENAAKNIQIHGGIGFSDEADPHLLLKRAQLLITLAGGLEAANRRIAEAGSWQ
jgi:alkylation response protein AidB-like acyl-CoA dehydrogenase